MSGQDVILQDRRDRSYAILRPPLNGWTGAHAINLLLFKLFLLSLMRMSDSSNPVNKSDALVGKELRVYRPPKQGDSNASGRRFCARSIPSVF